MTQSSSSGAAAPGAGMLLLAAPGMRDPNFAGSVVFLISADDEGAFGVIINRPSQVPVASVLAAWGDVVSQPEVLFHGGPVGPDGAIAMAKVISPDATPVGYRGVCGLLGLVDLDTPTELVDAGVAELRIFAGYAGWGSGQLEGEIAQGDWYVVPAEAGDLFHPDQTTLWRDVLRRQPGELAWHSTRPADVDLN